MNSMYWWIRFIFISIIAMFIGMFMGVVTSGSLIMLEAPRWVSFLISGFVTFYFTYKILNLIDAD